METIDTLTSHPDELQKYIQSGSEAIIKAWHKVYGEKVKLSSLGVELPNAYKTICYVYSAKTKRNYGKTIRNNMRYFRKLEAYYTDLAKEEKPLADYPETYNPDVCRDLAVGIIEELGMALNGMALRNWDWLLMQAYAYAVAELIQDGHPQKFGLMAAMVRYPMEIFASDADDLGFDAWEIDSRDGQNCIT